MTKQARVRAPELAGRDWVNTGGERLRLADLRGRIVLLDFWTSGCVNCLHVLDELRPLEAEFADVLVTIGVHSPKFQHEGEAAAIEAAVRRYEVHHPVVNDPELETWSQYAVRAWPTLVIVDPEGYVVHVAAGEGHAEALRRVIAELVRVHEAKGTLRRGGSPYVPVEESATELRFPAKAVSTVDGKLLVADAGNHSVVELDGESVRRRFGTGKRGEPFTEPSGIALLPEEIAAQVGYHAVVADTAAHLLRGLNLETGEVSTIAGTGQQWRNGESDGKALEVDLTSPWDVIWWEPANALIVAMAGNHTLAAFDPREGTVRRFAGTTVEGLRDGDVSEAFFAQTSGFAVTPGKLWLADAETSALRWIEPSGSSFTVHTAIGIDLFSFGHRDGDAEDALLQHPLGLAALPDGSIAIADTYNGAIRRYDPETRQVSTVASGLAEPSGLLVRSRQVLVVESAAHTVRVLTSEDEPSTVSGDAHVVRRPPSVLAPGTLEFSVVFTPPPGEKLDDRYGPSTRLEISASPPELLIEGEGVGTELSRTIRLAEGIGEGVLQVVAQAASCDSGTEHPVCRVTRQDWGVPVRLDGEGARTLELMMAGTPAES